MKKIPSLALSVLLVCSIVYSLFSSQKSREKRTEQFSEQKSESRDALQFLSTARAFPGRDIPADAYQNALVYYKTHFESASAVQERLSSVPWQNIGPNNVGGRTLSMALDPLDSNIIWMGSASGGLWKSTTGGLGANAWTYIPTGYPVRGISAIVINPADRNIMYIGTGETYSYGTSTNGLVERPTRGSPGMGILKSTDGGLSWSLSLDWQYNQVSGVWDIVMNPGNPNVLYAATTEGIYKSNDAGASWSLSLNQRMVMDLLIDPVDTNTVYAGVGNVDSTNAGIYQTDNSGVQWTRLSNGLPGSVNTGRISLALNPQNHRSVLALIANLYDTYGIYRSFDKGQTWNSIFGLTEIVSYQGWYAKGICFKENDSTRVLFGGVDLFRSDQSGDFPNLVTNYYDVHPDIHDIICNPAAPGDVYILTDGGLFRSYDFGDNFIDCNDGYVTSQAYIGSVSAQSGTIMLAGLQDNNTILNTGSLSWTRVVGGDGCFNAIDPISDWNQYCALQYLNVFKSTDQGFSFSNVLQNYASAFGGNNAAFLAPFILCPSNSSVLYAGSDTLYKSVDEGITWTPTSLSRIDSGNVALSIAASALNEDSIYVSTAPTDIRPMHIFRSGDGGATLTDISAGLPNRYPRDLAVDPRNSQIVYVAFSGFGAGHLFKSTDAGSSWSDISTTLPDVPFHCITPDPTHPDTLFAGSDLGMYVSIDGGTSWDDYNDGLPMGALVFDIQFSPSDNSIVAFTHGNGVYKRELTTLPVNIDDFRNKGLDILLAGNPAHETATLQIKITQASELIVVIYNAAGGLVKSQTETVSPGQNSILINTGDLPAGNYFINVKSGNASRTCRMIKI